MILMDIIFPAREPDRHGELQFGFFMLVLVFLLDFGCLISSSKKKPA